MPAVFSVDTATDAARRLTNALTNTTSSVPFTCFDAQKIDAIQTLTDIFAATVTPT